MGETWVPYLGKCCLRRNRVWHAPGSSFMWAWVELAALRSSCIAHTRPRPTRTGQTLWVLAWPLEVSGAASRWLRVEQSYRDYWVGYHVIPYHAMPYHTMPYHVMPCHAMPCHATPYHTTITCYRMPLHAMRFHAISYHTIPYHATHHHTTPHYAVLHCFALPPHRRWSKPSLASYARFLARHRCSPI